MKRKWMSQSALILVAASLVLGACGQKEEKTMSSSMEKTEQTSSKASSSDKTSSSKDQDVKSSAKEAKSESMPASSMEKEEKTEANNSQAQAQTPAQEEKTQETVGQASSIDLNALAAGDLSSIAGTWVNDEGDSLTFSNENLVSNKAGISFNGISAGRASFAIYAITEQGPGGGAAFLVLPQGAAGPGGTTYSQDAIIVGQSIQAEDHPYYKVN